MIQSEILISTPCGGQITITVQASKEAAELVELAALELDRALRQIAFIARDPSLLPKPCQGCGHE